MHCRIFQRTAVPEWSICWWRCYSKVTKFNALISLLSQLILCLLYCPALHILLSLSHHLLFPLLAPFIQSYVIIQTDAILLYIPNRSIRTYSIPFSQRHLFLSCSSKLYSTPNRQLHSNFTSFILIASHIYYPLCSILTPTLIACNNIIVIYRQYNLAVHFF